jgi:SAM-dependent methyltransferase
MPEAMACRSCGSKDLRDLGACAPFANRDALAMAERIQPEAGRLIRCGHCGLAQRSSCPSEEALADLYRQTGAEAMDYDFTANSAWVEAREFLQERWSTGDAPRILDVGCHTGAFLAGLPAQWSRFGIESATAPIAIARSRGVEVIAPRLQDVSPHWHGSFDAVCLFDVLEHLVDPAAGLVEASRLLKDGGLLLASTADFDAWTWKLARGRHWYLQSPQHLSIASPRFFRHVAAGNGLDLERVTCIPHRRGSFAERMHDRMATLYWELRERGGLYRLPQRAMHLIPGLSRLRHRQSVPWSMRLADHVFVAMRLAATSRNPD